MFDIGWTELVIVGVVALIVIGPKELPGVLRMIGQWMGKVRRMAADFQGQFNEAMREAEMADLKKQVDDLADTTRDLTSGLDPIRSMEDSFDDPFEDKLKEDKAKDEKSAVAEPGALTPPETADSLPPPRAEPEPGPAAEPAPTVHERASSPPAHRDRADADDAPPPHKAAAGGHSV